MPDLIVNADDFGRTAGVSKGIIEAHKKGIVTSTTTMINYPDAPAALEAAAQEAPFLGVGLHLTLTSGAPVSGPAAIPSLVVDGRFHGAGNNLPAFALNWQAEDIERELRAQFDRFVSIAGKLPDHLDSHHHAIYMYPATLRVMLALAREHGLPIRRPEYGETAMDTAASWLLSGLPPAQARQIADELHALLGEAERDVPMPARLLTEFYDQTAILGELLTILTNLQDGVSELMCHPGYAEGLDSPYNTQRERELKWLTFASTHEVIASEQIHLMSFADLKDTH